MPSFIQPFPRTVWWRRRNVSMPMDLVVRWATHRYQLSGKSSQRPPRRSHTAEAIESFTIALLKCRNESKDKIHRSRNCTFKCTLRGHAILSADVYPD